MQVFLSLSSAYKSSLLSSYSSYLQTTMVDTKPYLQFLFFFVSFFLSSPVLSRTLEQIPKTSVFDVSASRQKTIEILSFNPETLQQLQQEQVEQDQQSASSGSSFTLKLYSRDTLLPTQFKNYRDLTLSRLERNEARVNYLYKKLNLAINGTTPSNISPMDLETPVTSGACQGVGSYFTRFGIGTPPKQFYTTIDTGSDITWIQCTPCQCYNQTDPKFDPSQSSTYKQLTCDSQPCTQLDIQGCRTTSNTCAYQVTYGDGSYTIGDFVTETFTIGNSVINNVAIGCGRDNEGLFRGSAGLLGLGGGSLSFPSQIKATSFSYCLVDRDSTASSTLEIGSSVIASDAVTTPLLRNSRIDTFYYVGLTGISVGGELLTLSPSVFALSSSGGGGVIVDSGTTSTYFPTNVYNELRGKFVNSTRDLQSAPPFGPYDTCFDITSKASIEVPTVDFHFGSKTLSLPAKNYMRQVDNNVICLAFRSTTESTSIIGNVQQQEMRVTYDLGKSLIGFSPNKC